MEKDRSFELRVEDRHEEEDDKVDAIEHGALVLVGIVQENEESDEVEVQEGERGCTTFCLVEILGGSFIANGA